MMLKPSARRRRFHPGQQVACACCPCPGYSVTCEIVDTRVRARFHGDELIVTAVGDDGHSCAAAQRGDAP
ncbi:hypothetical protein [Streptomyces mirabilis]|uniref:hypothetical protein n=1 Tax=Streptomyces mirabilis TaxID=68239 RepID=UPI0036DA0F5E